MSDWDKFEDWVKNIANDIEDYLNGDAFKAKVKELRLKWQADANSIINAAEEKLVKAMVDDAKALLPMVPSSEVEKFARKNYWIAWNEVEKLMDIQWIEDTK